MKHSLPYITPPKKRKVVDPEHTNNQTIILNIVRRAHDYGLLAEVFEAFLESDAKTDVEAMQEAARECDL